MPGIAQHLRYELMHLWMWTQGLKFLNVGVAESGIKDTEKAVNSETLLSVQTRVYDLLLDRLEQSLEVPSAPSILEIGAGISPGQQLIKKYPTWRYQTLDTSCTAVIRALLAGHRSRLGLISRLPISDQSIDVVCALECLCVVDPKEREAFLLELRRVLKPSGYFISIDFYPKPFNQAKLWLQESAHSSGFKVEWIEDLSAEARQSILAAEPERCALFERIPSFIKQSDFGKGLRESLNLKGSEKYQQWLSGSRAYFIYALRFR